MSDANGNTAEAAAATNGNAERAATAGASASASAPSSSSSPIDAMVAGQSFLSFASASSGDAAGASAGAPRSVFVWYDASSSRFGMLYQTDRLSDADQQAGAVQQRPKEERSGVPMHRVSDVYLGKRAAEFSSPAASSYPSSQCFSIVSRDRSLHLVAPSEPIRAVWLQGVKEVFAKQKEAAAAKKKGSASATAPLQPQTQTQQESAQTAPAAVTETAAPVAVATAPVASTTTAAAAAAAPVAPPNVLAEGRRYRSVVLDASAPGGATATEIFLWHDPTEGKLGTLHWCVPSSSEGSVTKTKSAGKSMAVKTIRDVMLGKQTAELRSEFARDVPSSSAFSLMVDKEKGEGLHLIAASDAERNATLATIKGFWATSASGKKSKNNTATAGAIATAAAAAAPAQTAAPAAATTEPASASAAALTASDQAALADAARKVAEQQPSTLEAVPAPEPASAPASGVVRVHLGGLDAAAPAPAETAPAPAPAAEALVSPSPTSADKEAAAALSAHVASDPQRNIDTMSGGCVFRCHDLTPPASASAPAPVRDVFVFLGQDDPADGAIGTIYWNEGSAADKTRSSERALNLASVKDIFVGKHAWKAAGAPFASQSAALPSSRALSVVAAGGRALHLEAPSDEARARWATGIRNCFEVAHRKADATRKAQRSASPPAAGASTNGASADQRAAAELLSRGSDFTSHVIRPDSSLVALPVFVWYEPASAETGKMGSVFWCEQGQRSKVQGQSIPLHKVSDVFLGKHATLKSRPEMASVRGAHMFTLATRSSAVHLEARDAAQRAEWIAAIKGLFINSGKKVDSNGAPARAAGAGPNFPEIPMSPRNGAGSSGAASPRSLAQEGQNPLPVVATPIGEGADFEAWSFVLEDSSASSSSASSAQQQKRRLQCKQVHVWFEHDPAPLGALYWSDANAPRRVRVPGAVLPLSEVSDVFIGKLVDEFSHADANHIPADRCVSLRSATNPSHNLNLVAPSAQAQRRWVRGLKQQFSASPDTVIETRPLGSAAQEAATSPRSARAIQLKLDALAAGHDATLLDEGGLARPVTVWLDRGEARAGTIYFSDRVEGASKELQQRKKDETRKIPVHTISDVYVGKKTAAFKASSASSIPSNTAFSVGNKASSDSSSKAQQHKRLLNAYTRTPAERAMIIQGIEAAIIAAGTPVREYVHGQPKDQNGARRAAVPQGNAVESNPGALARTSTMQQGTTVLLHSGTGATAGQATFLWYEPGVGKQGAFRWTAVPDQGRGVAHRRFQKGHELKLQHISDVMSGRQSAPLRGAEATRAGARNANCFSLHTRSGAGLHIQMATPAERDAWLAALRSVFALTNKRIVEGAGAPGAAAASKLADGALVDTWFGRGRVAGATRADGITRVDVGDTRCYFNAESIKTVPTIYTPFGPGVAPRGAGAAVREDGIRRVELPWATAFLNEESCSDRDPASSSSGSGAGALHQSRDASVAFLSSGAMFVRITSRGTSQTVWASLNASGGAGAGGLGVLEFRHESTGPLLGSITMASMCDLLVGRQTAVLRAVGPATAPDSRAFTLVAERGAVSIDLVAPRDQDRTDWIYALFNLLASSGRKVTQQRGDASPSSPASSPVSPPLRAAGGRGAAGRRYSFSRPNGVPTYGESSRILARGVVCSILVVRPADHTRESALRSIVWLDVEEDRLYWMPLPLAPASSSSGAPEPEQAVWRQKHPLRSLPLSAVSDCYYNKKTAAFAERAFVGTPKHLCLSIAARPRPASATAGGEEVEWNIVCPGKEDRDEIFFALQGLLTSRDRAEKVQAALLQHNSPTSSAHSVAPSSSEEQWSPRGAAPAAAAAPAPVSPAAAAAAAAAKVPVSGRDEQGFNVLSRGVMLTIWEGEGPSVSSSRAFLFHEYDAADEQKPAKYGSLYWNAVEGDRTRSVSRRFPLHTVRDVFCGKSTATTRSPALEQVPKGQVVSLVAAPSAEQPQPQALHMQVASSAHRAAFVNALKQFWGKARPQSPNASSASAVAAVPPPADFSPRASGAAGLSPSSATGSSFAFGGASAAAAASSSSAAAAPAALEVRQPSALVSGPPLSAEFLAAACSAPSRGALLLPPATALAFIQAGSAFVASSTSVGAKPRQEVDAFYVAAAGFDAPFGTIYTCPRGQRLMDAENDASVTALAVHRIEAVKVSATGLSFSVETSTQRLELQADSLDTVAGWLAGLQHVLAAGGFRITRGGPIGATEAEGGEVVFRIDDRTAEAINSPAAVLSLPGAVLRKVASAGLPFNALFPQYGGGAGKISRTALTLFEAEGSLWLAAYGTHSRDVEDESRKFPLAELLRVSVGGRLGALACSVQSRENYIDLEAASLGGLALFLGVLTHLLQGLECPPSSAGVAVIPEKESSTPSKRVYNLAPRRVARVAAAVGPTHAAGCSPVDVREAVSPRSEAEARANFEAVGAAVTAYTLKEGGVLQHKELVLWLCADPESESADSSEPATLLCWGSPSDDEYVTARMPDPSGDNLFPLDEVLSAQVGKLTPALLALGSEEAVPAAECFSITTAGTAIEGVARSAAEARAIVQAVLSRNPKSLVVKQ